MAVTRGRRRTGARGRAGIAAGAVCAAAPGAAIRGTSAPPPASGSTPVTASSATDSVLPGRSRGSASLSRGSLPPLPPGSRGRSPWSIFRIARRHRDRRGGCAAGRRLRRAPSGRSSSAGHPDPRPRLLGNRTNRCYRPYRPLRWNPMTCSRNRLHRIRKADVSRHFEISWPIWEETFSHGCSQAHPTGSRYPGRGSRPSTLFPAGGAVAEARERSNG